MHRHLTHSFLTLVLLTTAIASAITPIPCAAQTARSPRSQTARPPRAYDFKQAVMSDGSNRTYRVHVPATYDRSKPIPLVIVFHGLHMSGSMMSLLTRFETVADRKNFVVVYPDALGGKWDTAGNSGHDDVQFVTDMINSLERLIKVDTRRIYLAGMSNGGFFVERLACELPDRFAGIAVVAASMMEATANRCEANRRIPVIFFIGTEDPLVPSEDNEHNATLGKLGDAVGLSGLGSLSVPIARMGGLMTGGEAVGFWCRHNQCSLSPYTNIEPDKDPNDGTKVTKETFGSYNSEVTCYSIRGGGHTWPGAVYSGPSDIVGKTTQDIDATELISEFFLKHSN